MATKLRIYASIHTGIQYISLFLDAVEKNVHYDIIICGGGASGLLLANALVNDSAFDELSIAIIEKEAKNTNDRTWSFWEKGDGMWDDIVHKQWAKGVFRAKNFQKTFPFHPYRYKTIRSKILYATIHKRLQKANNITQIQAHIDTIIPEKEQCRVTTSQSTYTGSRVFSSIPTQSFRNQQKYPVLQQHFIGWFVKTDSPIFDPNVVDFMDFDLPQKNNTRFMYVLPFSTNEALVEYTLFSRDLLENSEYEQAIIDYLEKKKVEKYTIEEKEQGNIPMTAYDFTQHNTAHLMHIGTAGGWTKASTGFTLQKSLARIASLIPFLKTNQPLDRFNQRSRFEFFDLLFLDVLDKYNGEGHLLFRRMFEQNPPARIFNFLEEKTRWWQEFMLMKTFPIGRFLTALIKRLFAL